MADLEQQIINLSLKTVYIASAILIVSVILAVLLKKNKKLKLPLFILIAGAMIVPTIVMSYGTVYLNTHAESDGPVHWHADIEFWACGSELELRDPIGRFSNKIGSSTFHEHNDKRLHLEGVVVHKKTDASLKKFMQLSGGYLTDSSIGIPLNQNQNEWLSALEHQDGDKNDVDSNNWLAGFASDSQWPVAEFKNGHECFNNGAKLQIFVYTFNKNNNTYSQKKLAKPTDYMVRDESVVPPGDCVIVEYDQPKERTNKLCQQYGVRDESRCIYFGVKEFNPKLCNIREVE